MLWTFLAQTIEHQTVTITQSEPPVWATIGGIFCGLAVFFAIEAVISYFLWDAQKRLPPEFQKIQPGMIWLLMIPLVHLVWNFFALQQVPESYAAYYHSRGRTDVGDAGKSLGLWASILAVCAIIPCVGFFCGIASLVLVIILLVKITGLKNQLATLGTAPAIYGVPGAFPPNMPPGSVPPPPPYNPPSGPTQPPQA